MQGDKNVKYQYQEIVIIPFSFYDSSSPCYNNGLATQFFCGRDAVYAGRE
jgi:hypothetical protein